MHASTICFWWREFYCCFWDHHQPTLCTAFAFGMRPKQIYWEIKEKQGNSWGSGQVGLDLGWLVDEPACLWDFLRHEIEKGLRAVYILMKQNSLSSRLLVRPTPECWRQIDCWDTRWNKDMIFNRSCAADKPLRISLFLYKQQACEIQ